MRFATRNAQFTSRLREDYVAIWAALGDLAAFVRPSTSDVGDYASCFLSYCTADEEFTRVLAKHLIAAGVRVWCAPDSLTPGTDYPQAIEDAVESHERMIVVVSEASVRSRWVLREAEAGIDKESRTGHEVLIPVTLDAALLRSVHVPAWTRHLRRNRQPVSFAGWQEPETLDRALHSLLRGLERKSRAGATDA